MKMMTQQQAAVEYDLILARKRIAELETENQELRSNQIPGRCKDCNASSGFEIAGHRWCREIHDNVEIEHYCSWWEEEK